MTLDHEVDELKDAGAGCVAEYVSAVAVSVCGGLCAGGPAAAEGGGEMASVMSRWMCCWCRACGMRCW